jgi:hypothetical protein
MFVLIADIPRELRPIADEIDGLKHVGNHDRGITGEELEASAPSIDAGRLGRLREWVRGAAGGSEGSQHTLGDGVAKSTIYPAVDGVQREVIELDRPWTVGREPVEVPAFWIGAGVIGARITTDGRGVAKAKIGGQPIGPPPVTGAAHRPLHGPMTLSADGPTVVKSIELFYRAPGATETTDYFPIERTVRAGETYELALSPHRAGLGIDQIESIWTASYAVPDPSGRRSDEGKPFYLDGVYCDIFLVDEEGRERKIDRTKFVDANEVDNSHDLGGVKGARLQFKFYAKDPAGENHPISFRGVRVRYASRPVETAPVRLPVGRTLAAGETAEVELPAELRGKQIGRVDVRWTDMLSGTWTRPGYARGTLTIDGRRIGPTETVQSPETQSFTHLGGARAAAGKVGVAIDGDRAKVDWIEIHFED